MRIGIVGAGMAGLSCADALSQHHGHTVVLVDKGRGPGGRMSTRRVEADGQTWHFDHGAQYFTVRDTDFARTVADWSAAGIAARWPAAGADSWVGTPGMNAPVRAMAARHDVRWGTPVERIAQAADGWVLTGVADTVPFDAVVVAVPAEQAATLLRPVDPAFAARAAETRSAPCWTAMIAFDAPVAAVPAIIRDAGPIGWATRDGAKPGRGDAATWVVQATPAWSADHLEAGADAIAPMLFAALQQALGTKLPPPVHLAAHRWRYARTSAAGSDALWDAVRGIGACGDWLLAPRVEAAWLSGRRLAALIG